jgi:hypothetical protein
MCLSVLTTWGGVLGELESLGSTKDVELKEPVVQIHDDVGHAAIAPVQVIRRIEPCDLRLPHLCILTTGLGFFRSPVVANLDDLLALFFGEGFVPVRP